MLKLAAMPTPTSWDRPEVRKKIEAGSETLELRNETKGESYAVSLPLTERQRGMILAGGLINFIRTQG